MENTFIKDILLVLFGWLLGLLGPAIVSAIRDKREAISLKKALLTELQEFQYRLLLSVYQIESRHGELNHDFFKLAQSVLIGYSGINSSENLLKNIGPLLNLTENEMVGLSQYAKHQSRPGAGLSLKKHALSLLESSLGSLSKFDVVFQSQLLDIKTRLGFMNEMIDDSRYYFQLSFQNGISTENYQIATANMIDSYKSYAIQARNIIETIGQILK